MASSKIHIGIMTQCGSMPKIDPSEMDKLAQKQNIDLKYKTVRVYPVKSAEFAAFTWKSEKEGKLSTYYDFVQAEVETHKLVLKRIGCSELHIQNSSQALKDALESVLVNTTFEEISIDTLKKQKI